MTAVLSIPHSDGHAPFGSPLQRSSPQSSFIIKDSPPYTSPSTSFTTQSQDHFGLQIKRPLSDTSSAPSSPRLNSHDFSRQPSYLSTPYSTFSSTQNECEEEDDNYFPSYDNDGYSDEAEDSDNTASLQVSAPNPPSQPSRSTSALSRSHLFDPDQTTGDDMAIRKDPSRQVDYLSHTWSIEDVLASWRYVVVRKDLYTNGTRLENASWRTWAKAKYHLDTISPERLNWYYLRT